MLATNMLLEDGEELLLWGNIAVHFGDASKAVDAASEDRGIFRVWSTPAELFPDIQRRLSDLPYTESGHRGKDAMESCGQFRHAVRARGYASNHGQPAPVRIHRPRRHDHASYGAL